MIKLLLLITGYSWLVSGSIEGTAHVQRISGIYIYTDSYPDEKYKVLGTVKERNVNWDTESGSITKLSYVDMRNDLIRSAKKKYKDCQGIVIDINNDRAEVIKFE